MRKLAGLECMVTVLITAECWAAPYYRTVYRVSSCPALRAICRRILREEAQHLLYQASTLAVLQRLRSFWWRRLTYAAQHVLLAGTCVTVWAQHGRLLRHGGTSFLSFVLDCRALLRHVQRAARSAEIRDRVTQAASNTLDRQGALPTMGYRRDHNRPKLACARLRPTTTSPSFLFRTSSWGSSITQLFRTALRRPRSPPWRVRPRT